jgi:hypothetical protein
LTKVARKLALGLLQRLRRIALELLQVAHYPEEERKQAFAERLANRPAAKHG